jgi:hypothetical protein
MILRRFALFLALVLGLAMTQLPEFVQQYRQRLGGAIGELAATVSRFDSDSAQQGLTQSGGIDRLRANPDAFVRQRGDQEQENVARLEDLRAAQAEFRNESQFAGLVTFARHYDARIARGAFDDFAPAVPTSPEAFVLGLIGFLFGGGVVTMTGHQVRRGRRRRERASETTIA